MTTKVIFISYSQESESHSDKVLKLANELCREGYEVLLDQYIAAPSEGWTQWMSNGLAQADFVLMVCTETYFNRMTGKETEGVGKGVKWEAREIRNYLYAEDSISSKFIPVLFNPSDSQYIINHQSDATYYLVNSEPGYEDLLRRLADKHRAAKPERGEPRTFEERTPKTTLFETTGTQPWVDIEGLPETSTKLFGRRNELKMLDEAWQNPKTRVISFIAWGGVGKSSLINTWLDDMKADDFRGAEQVFGHSFYSQGTDDQSQVSVEHFLNAAFDFLEYQGERPTAPDRQGKLLAKLFCKRKTLLVLDGLEPMQFPPGVMKGALKDQALKALLKSLESNLNGLCVITSRVPVMELRTPGHQLENLTISAGVELLESLHINGLKKELAQAVIDIDGHALTLSLMANYLATVHEGDIHQRDRIGQFTEDEEQGEHANKVMKSYQTWLAESRQTELNILYLISLFDRPADKGAVEALLAEPAINGITDHLLNLTDKDWSYALKRLHGLQLVAAPNKNLLDCHPLIRQFFASDLEAKHPEAFKQAHTRLYEYYRALPKDELPKTLEAMQPLFTAVTHGCLSGLHQQAMEEVYWPRILQENSHYVIKQLGAFGTDLACVACFFERCWDKPAEGLNDYYRAGVLNWAAFGLRGLGRLQEAVAPFLAGLKLRITQEIWNGAATNASNASGLYLVLGQLSQAIEYAEQSISLIDKTDDEPSKMINRTALADALFHSGQIAKAKALFEQAEQMQQERQPEYNKLYSLQGFRYCQLLLAIGEVDEVIERSNILKTWRQPSDPILDISLEELAYGQALFLKAINTDSELLPQAKSQLEQAVDGLRKAGAQDDLPSGLLARAELNIHQNDHKSAWQDLDEVVELASYSEMLLFLTEYHLLACGDIYQQLMNKPDAFLVIEAGEILHPDATQMRDRFDRHLAAAAELIERTGYHLRDADLAKLQALDFG